MFLNQDNFQLGCSMSLHTGQVAGVKPFSWWMREDQGTAELRRVAYNGSQYNYSTEAMVGVVS